MTILPLVFCGQSGISAAKDGNFPKEGSWTKIAARARAFHTATRLSNGKVLVAGGCTDLEPDGSCNSVTTSAEIFDPARNSWKATGSLTVARGRNNAVLLSDGRVVVIGVEGMEGFKPDFQSYSVLSAEIYDPPTGKWKKASQPDAHVFQTDEGPTRPQPMHVLPSFVTPSATLLSSGPRRVCRRLCGNILSIGWTTQFYDPRTDMWSVPDQPRAVHTNHTTALLPDGKVLVTADGSRNQQFRPGEIFDPSTGKWRLAADQPVKRAFQTTSVLRNGNVLVAGGMGSNSATMATPTAELFEPRKMSPADSGSTYDFQNKHSQYRNDPKSVDDFWRQYFGDHPTQSEAKPTGAWRGAKPLSTGRLNHSAAVMRDGRVLALGGSDQFGAAGSPLASAEIYDPQKGIWTSAGEMSQPRGGISSLSSGGVVVSSPTSTATALNDGRVLALGGSGNSADIFSPKVEKGAERPKSVDDFRPAKGAKTLAALAAVVGLTALIRTGMNRKRPNQLSANKASRL